MKKDEGVTMPWTFIDANYRYKQYLAEYAAYERHKQDRIDELMEAEQSHFFDNMVACLCAVLMIGYFFLAHNAELLFTILGWK